MSHRIHQVLDGELSAARLSPMEAAELDATEEAVRRALSGVRTEAVPDITAEVMRRVAELAPHGLAARPPRPTWLQRAWLAVWQPRRLTLELRPAWALAGAALFALLLFRPVAITGPAGGPPLASSDPAAFTVDAPTGAGAQVVLVQFRLHAPSAEQVQLAGDFTGWQPAHTLHETAEGVWTITVPVAAGVHEYGFVVDGRQWTPDPFAPQVDDGFGGRNSRLDVVATSWQGL